MININKLILAFVKKYKRKKNQKTNQNTEVFQPLKNLTVFTLFNQH